MTDSFVGNAKELLFSIRYGLRVVIKNPEEIINLFIANPDYMGYLQQVMPFIRDAFPANRYQLILHVYHDPEIDWNPLTMVVREAQYSDEIDSQIDELIDKLFDISRLPQHLDFVLTTDFCKPIEDRQCRSIGGITLA